MGQDNAGFSRSLHFYITSVCLVGLTVILVRCRGGRRSASHWRNQWLSLVLTVLSGLLPVKLNRQRQHLDFGTFVIAGTLLFGPSGALVLVLLDALFISLGLFLSGASNGSRC